MLHSYYEALQKVRVYKYTVYTTADVSMQNQERRGGVFCRCFLFLVCLFFYICRVGRCRNTLLITQCWYNSRGDKNQRVIQQQPKFFLSLSPPPVLNAILIDTKEDIGKIDPSRCWSAAAISAYSSGDPRGSCVVESHPGFKIQGVIS